MNDALTELIGDCRSVADEIDLMVDPGPVPAVYAKFFEGAVVYIGMTENFGARPKAMGSEIKFDRVHVYPMHCVRCARKTEADLIARYRPIYNAAGRGISKAHRRRARMLREGNKAAYLKDLRSQV